MHAAICDKAPFCQQTALDGPQINLRYHYLHAHNGLEKDRAGLLEGFFEGCGGSLRVRAEMHFGDCWGPEPACYLTDAEIGLDEVKQAELKSKDELFQMPD